MTYKIVVLDEPQNSLFNQVFMQNRIHDLDEENVKAKEKADNCFEEIINNDINESNSKDEENTNYDQNELYFVKKSPNFNYKYKYFYTKKENVLKEKGKNFL